MTVGDWSARQALVLQSRGWEFRSTFHGVRKHLEGFSADAGLSCGAEERKGVGYRHCHSFKEPTSYTLEEINLKQNKKNLALCES